MGYLAYASILHLHCSCFYSKGILCISCNTNIRISLAFTTMPPKFALSAFVLAAETHMILKCLPL